MRILITGSEGRIGKLLTSELERDYELTLTDLGEASASDHRYVQGNLLDEDVCRNAAEGADAIVHLAAVLFPYAPRAYENNTIGTWNICTAGQKAGVKRIIFASSVHAYGNGSYKISPTVLTPPYLPIDEDAPDRPEDAYGLSKVAGEQMLRGFSDAYGIHAYCLRLPAVWGPEGVENHGARPPQEIPLLATRLMDPWLYIDIRDAVSAIKLAIEKPDLPLYGVAYLMADDTSSHVLTADLIRQYLPEWLPLGGDKIPGYAPWFSTERAKHDLGWQPKYSWRKES